MNGRLGRQGTGHGTVGLATGLAAVAGLLLTLFASQPGGAQDPKAPAAADPLANLDFAQGEVGQPPPGWRCRRRR